MKLLDQTLPVELTNGNDGRGNRWFSSAKLRRELEVELREFQREPIARPVTVRVTRILCKGQRLWDSTSVGRGNWKEIEDALVALGWWRDDGPKWIKHTVFEQDASQRESGPVVRVEVFEA